MKASGIAERDVYRTSDTSFMRDMTHHQRYFANRSPQKT